MQPDDGYPEDWQEQGWCCRECAVMAWCVTELVRVEVVPAAAVEEPLW